MENAIFRVFQLRDPCTDVHKNLHSWFRRRPHPACKYWNQSAQRRCVCARVKLSSLFLVSCLSIIVVNGLNNAFWWHSHSLYGLVNKNWNLHPLTPKIWKFAQRAITTVKSYNSGTVKHTRDQILVYEKLTSATQQYIVEMIQAIVTQ